MLMSQDLRTIHPDSHLKQEERTAQLIEKESPRLQKQMIKAEA
jgi:hypothetical protein